MRAVLERLEKKLKEYKKLLEKDDLDAKIKAKIRAEMDRRNFTEADATQHIIDRDRGNASKPKEPLLQSEQEVLKVDKNGQWALEKDNSVKPFGENIYNETANIGRKMSRTGEVVEGAGKNQAVRRYTTSGSSMSAAHEAAEAKRQKKKSKASVKTLKDMTPEEKKQLEMKYNTKIVGNE